MTTNEKLAADLGAAVAAVTLALLSRVTSNTPNASEPATEAKPDAKRGRPAKSETKPEPTEAKPAEAKPEPTETKPEPTETKPEVTDDPATWPVDSFRAAVLSRVQELGAEGAAFAVECMTKHAGARVKADGVPKEKRAAVLADLDAKIDEGAI